jgi:cytochrome c556
MMRWTILLAGVLLSACAGPTPSPYRPIADNKLLMQAVLDPMADVIWESAGAVITADGVQEIAPKNQEEWTHLRNSAVALAESGNLLMMSPRAKDDQEWIRLCQALIDTSVSAIKAAEARNVDDVFDAGGAIYAVCSNCHSKYMPSLVRVGND